MKEAILLTTLAGLGYVQNMAFTWASRSRNQSDPDLHRWAALTSNSIFFVVNVLIWGQLWKALTTGEVWKIVATGLVYTISTTEGSVQMMKVLISKGK